MSFAAGIAVRFVHGKHERSPGLGQGQQCEQLIGALLHPVGIVLPDVRVGVEQGHIGHLIAHDVSPGLCSAPTRSTV